MLRLRASEALLARKRGITTSLETKSYCSLFSGACLLDTRCFLESGHLLDQLQ